MRGWGKLLLMESRTRKSKHSSPSTRAEFLRHPSFCLLVSYPICQFCCRHASHISFNLSVYSISVVVTTATTSNWFFCFSLSYSVPAFSLSWIQTFIHLQVLMLKTPRSNKPTNQPDLSSPVTKICLQSKVSILWHQPICSIIIIHCLPQTRSFIYP